MNRILSSEEMAERCNRARRRMAKLWTICLIVMISFLDWSVEKFFIVMLSGYLVAFVLPLIGIVVYYWQVYQRRI